MGFDKFAWVSISLGFVRVFMGFYRFIWICTRIMGIHIYILSLFKTYEPKYAPNTRGNHARGQGTRARDPTDTRASARASAQGTNQCARERAWNQTLRARARKEPNHARASVRQNKGPHAQDKRGDRANARASTHRKTQRARKQANSEKREAQSTGHE
jgi:hypothetical protein